MMRSWGLDQGMSGMMGVTGAAGLLLWLVVLVDLVLVGAWLYKQIQKK